MTASGYNSNLFRWKRLGSAAKPLKNDDVDQWRKRVEKASEFAVSEVFFHKKNNSDNRMVVPLQNSDQLRDHDDAYGEAQALLGDWLGTKLRLELGMDDEDDVWCSAVKTQPAAPASPHPVVPTPSNFDDLYNCLAEEEEQSAVNSFLQDLMEQDLLVSGTIEELSLDDGEIRKKFRNPIITMEARHQQVRENRARREAERQRQQREKEARQEARKEAKRREREEELKKKLEQCRQEEMLQLEMTRLRRQMEERRGLEQLVRQREREKEVQRAGRSVQSTSTCLSKQQHQETERLHREQEIQMKIHMRDLKCLHRHFSEWYMVVMDRRLRMGKAVALCDWRRQLKAWRAWRTVVWAERERREVAETEKALRMENRQIQLAVESDRRRLLRRCLSGWQLGCRVEKAQRELLARQQERKQKMAALLAAASTGQLLGAGTPADQPITAPPEPPNQSEETDHHKSNTLAPPAFTVHPDQPSVSFASRPSQPWQVTRRHAAPTAAELHEAQQRAESGISAFLKRTASQGGRFENRHAVQQQIITQQRKLLKEQQEQISQLTEKQNMLGLELEMEKTAQLTQLSVLRGSRPKTCSFDLKEQRAPRVPAEPDSQSAPSRKAVTRQTCPHPIITAMEARARQRAERRKEIEELKRKKEEEKLAEMKAAEEQRQREEEEEKRKAAEMRREEKRLEREREEEKQRQQKRHQELTRLARQHYRKTLLSHRGLAPWKRLIQLRQDRVELAENHHQLFLLRRCTLRWRRHVRQSVSEREALAEQLYQHVLLRRSFNCWKRMRDAQMIQEERADRFHRRCTLRRFLLALLDHVTQERLVEWDRRQLAQEHSNRRILQRCLLAWRQLPSALRRERRRDERREKLSRKVAEVLPDFCSYPSSQTD